MTRMGECTDKAAFDELVRHRVIASSRFLSSSLRPFASSPHRALARALGVGGSLSSKTRLIIACFIFLLSFAVKSLHATDVAPVMHTRAQEQCGMSAAYLWEANSIVEGHGILL